MCSTTNKKKRPKRFKGDITPYSKVPPIQGPKTKTEWVQKAKALPKRDKETGMLLLSGVDLISHLNKVAKENSLELAETTWQSATGLKSMTPDLLPKTSEEILEDFYKPEDWKNDDDEKEDVSLEEIEDLFLEIKSKGKKRSLPVLLVFRIGHRGKRNQEKILGWARDSADVYIPESLPETIVGKYSDFVRLTRELGVNYDISYGNYSHGLPPFWSPTKECWVDIRDEQTWKDYKLNQKKQKLPL